MCFIQKVNEVNVCLVYSEEWLRSILRTQVPLLFYIWTTVPHLLSTTLYLNEIELMYLEHGKHDRVEDNEAPK